MNIITIQEDLSSGEDQVLGSLKPLSTRLNGRLLKLSVEDESQVAD